MEYEKLKVANSLKQTFSTAHNIYIDTVTKECEVSISVDDYEGESLQPFFEEGVKFHLVDYCDTYPFKYVFNYVLMK